MHKTFQRSADAYCGFGIVAGKFYLRKYFKIAPASYYTEFAAHIFSQANDHEELEKAIEQALECGYRHFDTASYYQNEHILGKVLRRWLDTGRVKREDLFIVTKVDRESIQSQKVF